jgi:hypothetical protein
MTEFGCALSQLVCPQKAVSAFSLSRQHNRRVLEHHGGMEVVVGRCKFVSFDDRQNATKPLLIAMADPGLVSGSPIDLIGLVDGAQFGVRFVRFDDSTECPFWCGPANAAWGLEMFLEPPNRSAVLARRATPSLRRGELSLARHLACPDRR